MGGCPGHAETRLSTTRTDAGGPPNTRGRDAAIGSEVPRPHGRSWRRGRRRLLRTVTGAENLARLPTRIGWTLHRTLVLDRPGRPGPCRAAHRRFRSQSCCFRSRPVPRRGWPSHPKDSWTTPRRVVAKVEHHVGELFPRVGFIVTNLPLPNRAVVRFYNKRGHRRAMDQGGQASGALDAAVVSSVPGERGPAAAERARLQPRQSLAAAGAPGADRHLVADQSPAAPRQDGWAAGQARPVLLAPAGGEPPDAAAVRVDAPADLGAARADRLTGVRCRRPWAKRGRKAGEVSVRMSGASCRASQFGPPGGCFDARSIRGGILTGTRSGWCRMRPINGRQIGNVG